MTRERAEELVSDLLDACLDYEHAQTGQVEKFRRDLHQKREAMTDMLSLCSERAAALNLREALEAIAGFGHVNLAGEYEGGLRDIIRSMTDCAGRALENLPREASATLTSPQRQSGD